MSFLKRHAADAVTGLRIPLAAALWFCPRFSGAFLTVYAAAGLTDVLDGVIARKTGTVTEFGSRLDTAADAILLLTVLAKLLPAMDLPWWIHLWIGGIALLKAVRSALAAKRGRNVAVHNTANRVMGVLLFSVPFLWRGGAFIWQAAALCAAATAAAIAEWRGDQ